MVKELREFGDLELELREERVGEEIVGEEVLEDERV